MKYTRREIEQMSGLLHDLVVLKLKEVDLESVKIDYTRRDCLTLANKVFDLNIPEVESISSPNYKTEGEIIRKMVSCVK